MDNNNSQSLATESFSYSWLLHQKPHRFSDESQENFNFNVSESSFDVLVDADEIFSDGYIMPGYNHDRLKIRVSTSAPGTPISSFFSRPGFSNGRHCQQKFLGKLRKSSNKMLQKCCGILRPICYKLRCSRKSISVDDFGRKVWEIQRWSNSLQASPLRNSSADVVYVAECPIYEAILHCKRSIEK